MRLRFVISNEAGKPVGRLHVAIQPALKKADNSPILAVNVTARGAPLVEGVDGAFEFRICGELGRGPMPDAITSLDTGYSLTEAAILSWP